MLLCGPNGTCTWDYRHPVDSIGTLVQLFLFFFTILNALSCLLNWVYSLRVAYGNYLMGGKTGGETNKSIGDNCNLRWKNIPISIIYIVFTVLCIGKRVTLFVFVFSRIIRPTRAPSLAPHWHHCTHCIIGVRNCNTVTVNSLQNWVMYLMLFLNAMAVSEECDVKNHCQRSIYKCCESRPVK